MVEPVFECDVLIVGGGMVGTALACALGGSDLRVAVLEPGPVPQLPGAEYDLRVSAISAASCALFEAVGVWKAIKEFRVADIQEMRIWDAAGKGCIHFDAADIGAASLGYIIENSVMLAMLHQRMQQYRNVSYNSPVKLQQIQLEPAQATAIADNGQQWRARLLVGADGAHSQVRQLLGIKASGWDFQQKGIVATVTTEKPHQHTAWQRFLPTGPLAFLPLKDPHQCSIVWSADSARADALMTLDDAGFVEQLEVAFENALGAIKHISPRQAFGLNLSHARHYVQPRVALVGDAAHRMHPLAGQGVNMGYADAAVLAQVIMDAMERRKDVGEFAILRRYERWRRGDNTAMLLATDGFKRLFGTEQPLIASLRNTGLGIADKLQPFKNKIMRLASGLEAELPGIIKNVGMLP
ncbi:MAG: UbiH/UbiF/VisC/COQ6 family ubiquinone biosynthesis hydroxylase [Gammaproteobacteria bacterium]|nr:UbiH/UbiF/VisC/COQ6 family ubiquinone biosynthesis hydroxylase [Gammaproteobacteria bacterium]